MFDGFFSKITSCFSERKYEEENIENKIDNYAFEVTPDNSFDRKQQELNQTMMKELNKKVTIYFNSYNNINNITYRLKQKALKRTFVMLLNY